MLLKNGLILLAVCLVSACKEGPKVTICILDSVNLKGMCSDPEGKPFTKTLPEMENDLVISPEDMAKILESTAKTPMQKKAVMEYAKKKTANLPLRKDKWKFFN